MSLECAVPLEEFVAIQVTLMATLLFLLTADEQTYPNPTNLRELHHFYIGLVAIGVGILVDVPTLRYAGAFMCADDAWQHSAHTMHRDPTFRSPLAWLYAQTLWRIPAVRALNRWLDARLA